MKQYKKIKLRLKLFQEFEQNLRSFFGFLAGTNTSKFLVSNAITFYFSFQLLFFLSKKFCETKIINSVVGVVLPDCAHDPQRKFKSADCNVVSVLYKTCVGCHRVCEKTGGGSKSCCFSCFFYKSLDTR